MGFEFDFQHTLSAIIDAGCIAGLTALIGFMVKMCRLFIELKEALVDIIGEKIERKITRALDHGYVLQQELKSIEKLYARYKRLGGNSYIDELMQRLKEVRVQEN